LCNPGAQQAVREDFAILEPSMLSKRIAQFLEGTLVALRMHNFQGEAAQPAAGPSPGEQPMKGKDQTVIDRLTLSKKDTEA